MMKRASWTGPFHPYWRAVLALALISACSHPSLPIEDHAQSAVTQRILIATRTPLEAPLPFGAPRDQLMTYSRIDVGVPDTHRPGNIEWRGRDNPQARFTLSQYGRFQGPAGFQRSLQAHADTTDDVTLLFVHGYNSGTLKSLLRFAQINVDFQQNASSLLFAWTSANDPRAYMYDRDSVLVARDDLVDLLDTVTRNNTRDVAIIAHSMGAFLVMETLRQIALTGRQDLGARVTWVALVSPDIDPDVFRAQAKTIEDLPPEFYILSARQDRALSLASFLTGGRGRVGMIQSPEQVAGLDVTVLDLSDLTDGSGGDHSIAFRSPAAIQALIDLSDGTSPPLDGRPELLRITSN
mgnify:CR=1 FL=1